MVRYLVGVTALVALTFSSLASAVGSPSMSGDRRSGVASPTTHTASGGCSKATAVQLASQLHLGNAGYTPQPVAQVLCGAFVGPRSQAMAFSLTIPSCGGTAGWVVFRLAGGAWQLVLKRDNGADLAAVGSDIRETMSILRPGDAHCFPTGGTKARIWHWNGTRFTTSAWKQATPARGDDKLFPDTFFQTPSGNIVCYAYSGLDEGQTFYAGVLCVVKSGLKPQPRHTCEIAGGFTIHQVLLGRTSRAEVPGCGDETEGARLLTRRSATVLGYGRSWSGGGLRCASAITGLTCRNKSGHGFFLSRAKWRSF